MRPADIFVMLIFVGTLVMYVGGFFDEERPGDDRAGIGGSAEGADAVSQLESKPRRPIPNIPDVHERRALPAPRPGRDPVLVINAAEPVKDTVGTAFSLDSDGVFMTARHVVEGCDRLGLQMPGLPPTWIDEATVSPNADLAILVGGPTGPAFTMSDRLPDLGETGYGIGYPQGNPGDVSGTLMGRAISRSTGRMNFDEPILVWAEKSRFPKFDGGLGGISGGPFLAADGTILGVLVSETRRRGRFNTAAPRSIHPVLNAAPISRNADDRIVALADSLTDGNLADWGSKLRAAAAVTRVICLRN